MLFGQLQIVNQYIMFSSGSKTFVQTALVKEFMKMNYITK
jgi:hypothetical protein